MGSLVHVLGKARDKKFTREKRLETAKRCGIKFIELEWNEPLSTTIKVEGFQSVICGLRVRPGSNRPVAIAEWHKDAYGEDKPSGQLVFYPDELAVGRAMLPDSPFNRRLLAAAKGSRVQEYHVVDPAMDKKIDELSKAFYESEEYRVALAAIKEQQLEIAVRKESAANKATTLVSAALAQEEAKLKKQLADLDAGNRVAELRKKVAELEGRQQKPPSDPEADDNADLRKRIVQEVQAENPELIQKLKGKYRNFWKSEEYQKTLQPEIDKRLKAAIDERINAKPGHDTQG